MGTIADREFNIEGWGKDKIFFMGLEHDLRDILTL